jgi:MauM/NapG family ferredoxin protein
LAADPNATPHDRRAMFRLGLRKLMEPVAEYIEERLNFPLPVVRTVLRPPGALPEKEFLDTCYRCGNCVDICPAKAIKPLSTVNIEGRGTPYIDADLAACVVCDELACMRACPSGALKLVDQPGAIRMGLARVNTDACHRSRSEECTLCIDKCPLGTQAIGLGETGQVEVRLGGCVGCGVCQFYCPALPKAILVEPC